jgi:hypothetical protein
MPMSVCAPLTAADRHASFRRRDQPSDNHEKGAFSAAAGAEDGDEFTAADLQRDRSQSLDAIAALSIHLPHAADIDKDFVHSSHP